MSRLALWLHKKELGLFNFINHSCNHKSLNLFFRSITHLGGATFTISVVLLASLLRLYHIAIGELKV
ncbi:hypothetical protein [Lederbergia citri]|uniref:hypothetical protein n=1 Tax=Lederbergia citri TaxID=2833580 RepID=UPI002D7FF80A|nr:hypothetical protein [Lederbergia citri]